jgi:energy-coupling factor transporter ATP-binding protein EcfA2
MRVDRLKLKDFTAFREADFEFSPGLNILIGANGTGKSHAMKVLYSILWTLASTRRSNGANSAIVAEQFHAIGDKLLAVFRPLPVSRFDPGKGPLHALTRRGASDFHVDARGDFGAVRLDVAAGAVPSFSVETVATSGRAVFIPATEVLSVFEGFIAAYERRELAFDATLRDLCVDLSATTLRKVSPPELADLAVTLDDAVGGSTKFDQERFFVVSPSKDWFLEAPMLAEGLRKLAQVSHLIGNGSISEESVLFWDEPEASLNPKLITVVSTLLMKLARIGVQVFVATHDYLLADELSLAAEYGTPDGVAAKTRFFCLSRSEVREPVQVQFGDTLTDIEANPILQEFSAHYDREQRLFYGANPGAQAED